MRTSYHDIKAIVLDRIRKDVWPPGANLPGEIELAQEFGCARATVNRAMRELVHEGVLERKRKAGTRVKSSPSRKAEFAIPLIREEIERTGAAYRYVLVDRQVIPAPGWLQAQINIPRHQKVLHLRCMHYADSHGYQLEDRWINLAAVPDAENETFADVGPNEWLVRKVPFTEGELVFSALNATREIADFLNAAAGDALFTVERTTWLNALSVTYARLYFARGYKMTSRL
ncbi:UTRA domain-containing protein [Sulfitobacter sp. JB4-11]|uniref:UTRA domain-containing protein n=1 Tax=Sulfitobacter rhodophyticola TaxID=3238304 RepID=UPI003512C3C6